MHKSLERIKLERSIRLYFDCNGHTTPFFGSGADLASVVDAKSVCLKGETYMLFINEDDSFMLVNRLALYKSRMDNPCERLSSFNPLLEDMKQYFLSAFPLKILRS